MNNILESERYLREENDRLRRENHSLKTNWHHSDQELRTFKAWVPKLQDQIRTLDQERKDLRRRSAESTGEMADDIRELRLKYAKKKTDNERLTQTIRALRTQLQNAVDERVSRLTAEVQELVDKLGDLRVRYQTLHRAHDDLQHRHHDLNGRYVRAVDALGMADHNRAELQAENERLRRMVELHERISRRHGRLH